MGKNCPFDSTCPKAVNSSGHPACKKSICTIKDQLFVFGQGIGQRESFFQSRDENESFSFSISHIEMRPRIPEISEREFPWCDLGFWDENENSKSCHLSLNSGFNGLTILHAISGRLKLYKMHGSAFYFMFSHFEVTQSSSPSAYVVIFNCCHKCIKIAFEPCGFNHNTTESIFKHYEKNNVTGEEAVVNFTFTVKQYKLSDDECFWLLIKNHII